ncbi:MAG: M48 family metallopeptidase, partial [Alphaproteobacteria bacterium]|nr:M48 family metallopeptidase [Alphaproteobacteria bacterium]
AATWVPHGLEARLGNVAFETFDLLLAETELSEERQAEVAALFEDLRLASDLDYPVELHFRKGRALGPNAFALPAGPVMVTDELIELAPNDDALAGVFAHEIGHIEERHGLRRMMRAAGWVIMVSVIADDGSGLFEEVAAFPTLLIDQSYSRSFETQADDRAIEMLQATGRDPAAFAEMLELITQNCGKMCEDSGWLSSHPAPGERIDRITGATRTGPGE